MLGFTKKGKQFYSFDTNLAETISSFHVIDNSIWLSGEYTFTQLVDHAEAQFYIAPDRINDSDVSSAAAPHKFCFTHPARHNAALTLPVNSASSKTMVPAVNDPCPLDSWLHRAMRHLGVSGLQHSCLAEVHTDPSGKRRVASCNEWAC